jgi:predicted RNA-binding protein YlqC (UPF0109 family)
MRDLVETIVKELVDDADQVVVEEKPGEDETYKLIEVKVGPEDMGRVIGKEGRIAKSIRTIVRAAATKQGKAFRVDIVE